MTIKRNTALNRYIDVSKDIRFYSLQYIRITQFLSIIFISTQVFSADINNDWNFSGNLKAGYVDYKRPGNDSYGFYTVPKISLTSPELNGFTAKTTVAAVTDFGLNTHDKGNLVFDSTGNKSFAALIQGALIPDNKTFRNHFQDYFAIWHPKDTVGGDVYLFEELRDKDECLLMVIDCTGHGVPGAFVTMLVKAIERQITSKINYSDEEVSPAKILSIFNKNMKQLLKQESIDSISNAGFDGGIIYYNKREKILKFAGAETPLFYIEDDELKTIKGNRYSVGYKKCDMNYEYKEHIVEVKEEMQFYLTTDGYLDQNGGEKGFPFGKKAFKKIIEQYHTETMADQQEVFLNELISYQGEEETNDDVTLVGFKI